MKVTKNNMLEFMQKHIITRTSAYARQQKDGRYHKVERDLTSAAITRHLQHKITLGFYNTGDDGQVKFCLWDIDNHEGNSIIPDDIVKTKARKILTTLKAFDIPYTFAESSPGCFHIYVFFEPFVITADAHDFGRWIAKNANLVDIECFPKQREVSDGDYGNLIRGPGSLHQKKQTEYHFINDKFEYIDEFDITPIDISGFADTTSYTPIASDQHLDENIDDTFNRIFDAPRTMNGAARTNKGGVPPCLQACLENNTELVGGGGHYMRVSIVCAYRDIGLKFPALCQLFSKQADYKEVYTAKQVKSVLKKDGGYSYSCRSLREKCGRFVLRYCDNCPRGRRFKK